MARSDRRKLDHTLAFISELQLFISMFVCYLSNWEYVYLQANKKYAHTRQRKKRIQYSYEFDITQKIVAFSKFYKLKLIYCYRTSNEVLSNFIFFFANFIFRKFLLLCYFSLSNFPIIFYHIIAKYIWTIILAFKRK